MNWSDIWSKGRCGKCRGTNRVVPGDGPLRCKALCVGEAPGAEEDKGGRAFTGDAGKEWNWHLLPLAGLTRATIASLRGQCTDVYVTNVVKCRPPQNKKPGDAERECCGEWFLKDELNWVRGEKGERPLVVLMGGTAASMAQVQALGGWREPDLETYHGLPVTFRMWGAEYEGFVTYHPALALHDTPKLRELREDFKGLGRWIRGERYWKERTRPVKVRVVQGEELERVLERMVKRGRAALDTETDSRDELWSSQVSFDGETGWVVMGGDVEGTRKLGRAVNRLRDGGLYVHFQRAEREGLGKVGVEITERVIVDTMQLAFRRGMAQGLKPLAYRLAGMKMMSFNELVMPYSKTAVAEWLCEVLDSRFCEALPTYTKTGKLSKVTKNPPLVAAVNRWLRHIRGEKYNVWRAVREWESNDSARELAAMIESELGKIPRKGIERVPVGEALEYAGRDAVATWEVAERLLEWEMR